MADLIPFAKYEGLGNDFVLIDDPLDRLSITGELAAAICDRRLGIGADGLLVVAAARGPDAAARMRYWNRDGSPSAMCGNGIRCIAKHVRDRHGVAQGPFVIDTDAGPVRCRITADGEGLSRVEVELPAPRMEPAAVPVLLPEGAAELVRESNGRSLRFTPLSLGNPHAVTFDVDDDAERARLGPLLETDPAFPERVNVGFARLVGPAELRLTAPGPDRPVLMEGPARRVFEGTFVIRHLVPGSRPSSP
jgi:diaminopimelate epimerase